MPQKTLRLPDSNPHRHFQVGDGFRRKVVVAVAVVVMSFSVAELVGVAPFLFGTTASFFLRNSLLRRGGMGIWSKEDSRSGRSIFLVILSLRDDRGVGNSTKRPSLECSLLSGVGDNRTANMLGGALVVSWVNRAMVLASIRRGVMNELEGVSGADLTPLPGESTIESNLGSGPLVLKAVDLDRRGVQKADVSLDRAGRDSRRE